MENFRVEGIQKALEPPKVDKQGKARGAQASSAKEFKALEFSAKGDEVKKAFQAIMQSPDVREDKIKEIEEEIAQGEFQRIKDLVVERVAEKFISQVFGDGS